ncbi:MAG: type II secretion system F family protein, partial [Polynucleobacter sp.]|nr:type II secretion system F family protein [Polynucleobacter sp.]
IWKGIKNTQYQSGTINAYTRDEAAFKLKEDGVIITQLTKQVLEKEKTAKAKNQLSFKFEFPRKVKLIKLMIATKKMATMLKSGLAILPSLEMVRDQVDDPVLKKTMASIYKDVEAGSSLSKSFARFPTIFDAVYVNLVRAGESSGKLDIFLEKLVGSIKKTLKIRKSIQSALLYPAILMIVATIVLGIMMVFVVPVFAKMFGSIGSELPGPTLMIVNLSNFIRDPFGGGSLLLLIVACFIGFRMALKRSMSFRRWWHRLLLRIPVVGDMVLNSNIAQVAMVYGNLTNAGVPVIEALDITAESTKNEVIREGVQMAKRGVFSGEPLSKLLAEITIFPSAFSQLVSVGEQTGNMGEMLETISTYYEEEFDSAVDKLSQSMEPIMIVFLGGVIGFILVAMYLPIFKMGQIVSS